MHLLPWNWNWTGRRVRIVAMLATLAAAVGFAFMAFGIADAPTPLY
jgi:hypothetical protein